MSKKVNPSTASKSVPSSTPPMPREKDQEDSGQQTSTEKTPAVPVTVLSAQSSKRDEQESGKSLNYRKGVWGFLRKLGESRTFYEAIVVMLLGAFIAILWDRWTDEIGEHQKTVSRTERAEERERNLISERDQLGQNLANLRTKNEELERLHPILKFYGTRAKLVASYDLKIETGSELLIGNCPRVPCLHFRMQGIEKGANDEDFAHLQLGGIWGG